jgi:hypothetical protein
LFFNNFWIDLITTGQEEDFLLDYIAGNQLGIWEKDFWKL